MRITRAGWTGHASEHRTATFTGTVYANELLVADGIMVGDVVFQPGARTYWHSHAGGQLLQIKLGHGWVCVRGEEPEKIAAGDLVWSPADEVHWHGGTDSALMSHMAVSLGTTTWLEPVADEDYPGAVLL